MLALVLSVDRTGPIAMESVSGQMESARNQVMILYYNFELVTHFLFVSINNKFMGHFYKNKIFHKCKYSEMLSIRKLTI